MFLRQKRENLATRKYSILRYMDYLVQLLRNRKLSFIPHIKYLKAKCLKALELLKVLSHTSSVASLYVVADGPSLYLRRDKLSLQYAIRIAANPSNPAHEVTFPPNYVDLY